MDFLNSEYQFQIFFASVLGLLVGSFLNVVISRLPARMMWQWKQDAHEFLELDVPEDSKSPPGVVVQRSFCPTCKNPISWYDNVPVLSYLILRGKCRHCKSHISIQYPLVELGMAVLAGASVAIWGWGWEALAHSAFFAVMLACSGIDFKTQLIPDQIVLPSIWAALVWSILPQSSIDPQSSIWGAVAGYLILWTVFWIFKIITKKEGMGYGDFKLLALIGAVLGPTSLLPTILLASVLGAVIGSLLLIKRSESKPFAFGPYLALGGIVYAIFEMHIRSLNIFPVF